MKREREVYPPSRDRAPYMQGGRPLPAASEADRSYDGRRGDGGTIPKAGSGAAYDGRKHPTEGVR